VLLTLYFIVCSLARLFLLVVYYTPKLGLFYSFHPGQMGLLPASSRDMTYDVHVKNTTTTFNGVWKTFNYTNLIDDLFHIPKGVQTGVILLWILSYLVLSCAIQSKLRLNVDHVSCVKSVQQANLSVMCPPLFYDWEWLYPWTSPAKDEARR
jgi:hypothetical protein